jgi:hypothetical protein
VTPFAQCGVAKAGSFVMATSGSSEMKPSEDLATNLHYQCVAALQTSPYSNQSWRLRPNQCFLTTLYPGPTRPQLDRAEQVSKRPSGYSRIRRTPRLTVKGHVHGERGCPVGRGRRVTDTGLEALEITCSVAGFNGPHSHGAAILDTRPDTISR